MYKLPDNQKTIIFEHPFGGSLNPENRWIRLAHLIPWDELEKISEYKENFGKTGNPALNFRIAFGALFIQTKLKLTDEETVEQVKENPYLQYFLGLERYQHEPLFSPSLMVHFRKRLDSETLGRLNLKIFEQDHQRREERKTSEDTAGDDTSNGSDGDNGNRSSIGSDHSASFPQPENKQSKATGNGNDSDNDNDNSPPSGTLILDATCAPADIAYPTDLRLLNNTREKLEKLIDTMHDRSERTEAKPRTYRKKARRDYLRASKQRRIRGSKLRKALKQQLGYVRRDLKHVEKMLEQNGECILTQTEHAQLQTLKELYQQQQKMYSDRTHRVKDRIVSITQPHIRPMVRGKAKAAVEFGAKVALAIDNGYSLLERLSWDNFNESTTFIQSVESYFNRHGHYPEVVCADTIYRTRENLQYCNARGIRLSGPRLGRPPADTEKQKDLKRIAKEDSGRRNAVEGKFGEGKRAYGLGCIRGKLKETSETIITMQFIVMNLWRMLRDFLSSISGGLKYLFDAIFALSNKIVIHNMAPAA